MKLHDLLPPGRMPTMIAIRSLLLTATLFLAPACSSCSGNARATRDADPTFPDGAPSDWGSATAPDKVPYTGAFPAGKGALAATLTVASVARKVELYLPASLAKGAPLLITLHGTNDDAQRMINASGAKDLADQEDLVVASPWGRQISSGDWDNHGGNERYWRTYPETDPNQNPDLLLVRAIITEARRAYSIDPRRVYLLGHSNGGFFAITAAMALPRQIAAFAANSSGLVRCATTAGCTFKGTATSCDGLAAQQGWCSCGGAEKPVAMPVSGRRVPGFISHSVDDPTVSVYYSCQLAARMKALGFAVELRLFTGEGHGMPYPLAINAYSFMKKWIAN